MKNNQEQNKHILAITAHPDDHICFAGTVLKLRDKGYTYSEVVLSDAEESGMVRNGRRIKRVNKSDHHKKRQAEFREASRLLGTQKTYRLRLPNLGIAYDKKTALRLMEIIRAERPALAFIHHHADYMHDHIEASYLAKEALKIAAYSFRLDLGDNWRTPQVLEFEGINPIIPDVLVDITDTFDKKNELLAVYGSQFGDRITRYTEGAALYHGYNRRSVHAEAFEIPDNLPLWDDANGLI